MTAHARIPVAAVLGSAVVAITLFARTLGGGLLSDDLMFGVLGTAGDDGFDIDWAAVFADFGRPWLGFEAPFYRPMLTVSLAVDQQLGGGAAWPFHLTNILLHAAVAGAAAALAALLCPRRPSAAAWIAGLCVAVHPVAVEPVAWIAARNSGLEVFFRTLSMLLFAVYLRDGRRGARVAAIALAACAFATKESAVMLPVSLLALDLLDRPARPLGERARLHLPFALLVVGYFLLRIAVLGVLLGDGGATPTGTGLSRLATKLGALLHGGSFATAPLFGFVLAAGLFRARAALAIGALWITAHALPTWEMAMGNGLGGSRMVYGALPVLGGITARVLLDGASWLRVAPLIAVGTWAMLVLPTLERLDAFDDAWRDMDDVKVQIAALADRATPERPLAIAAMPKNAAGIPPCNPNAWFPLAERPHQPRDIPVVSLGFATVPVPLAESLHGDASAIRALTAQGCAIATWDANRREFLLRQRDTAPTLPELSAVDGQPGVFRFATPVAAEAVESLTVSIGGGAPATARVTFLTAVPDLRAELAHVEVGGGARIDVDLTHHMGPPSLATVGIPIEGFSITLDGPGRVERIDAAPRVPVLDLDGPRFDGGTATFDDLERRVAPAAAAGADLRLILLGPHAAIPVTCEAGAPIRIPDPVRREFANFARIAQQDRILFWFEALTPAGRPGFARSGIDWFELADAAAR